MSIIVHTRETEVGTFRRNFNQLTQERAPSGCWDSSDVMTRWNSSDVTTEGNLAKGNPSDNSKCPHNVSPIDSGRPFSDLHYDLPVVHRRLRNSQGSRGNWNWGGEGFRATASEMT